VYFSDGPMWHWDEVPNSVRHRDVSEYLLRNYEPLDFRHGNLILRRRRLSPGPVPAGLVPKLAYRSLFPCDWGYVPHFDALPTGAGTLAELGSLVPRTTALPGAVVTTLEGSAAALSGASYLELTLDDLKADDFSLSDEAEPVRGTPPPIAFR